MEPTGRVIVDASRVVLGYGANNPVEVLLLVVSQVETEYLEPAEPPERQGALARQAAADDSAQHYDRIVGVCTPIESAEPRRGTPLSPLLALENFFRNTQRQEVATSSGGFSVLQAPRHGASEPFANAARQDFRYTPQRDYQGDDVMTVVVEVNGQRYKLVYLLLVENRLLDDEEFDAMCPKPYWQVTP